MSETKGKTLTLKDCPYYLLSMYHFKDSRYAGTLHVISETEDGFEPSAETNKMYPGEFVLDRVIGSVKLTDSLELNVPIDYMEHNDGVSIEELSCIAD